MPVLVACRALASVLMQVFEPLDGADGGINQGDGTNSDDQGVLPVELTPDDQQEGRQRSDQEGPNKNLAQFCRHASTGLPSTPTPETSTSMLSPSANGPTPSGVPVNTRSPGSRVIIRET